MKVQRGGAAKKGEKGRKRETKRETVRVTTDCRQV